MSIKESYNRLKNEEGFRKAWYSEGIKQSCQNLKENLKTPKGRNAAAMGAVGGAASIFGLGFSGNAHAYSIDEIVSDFMDRHYHQPIEAELESRHESRRIISALNQGIERMLDISNTVEMVDFDGRRLINNRSYSIRDIKESLSPSRKVEGVYGIHSAHERVGNFLEHMNTFLEKEGIDIFSTFTYAPIKDARGNVLGHVYNIVDTDKENDGNISFVTRGSSLNPRIEILFDTKESSSIEKVLFSENLGTMDARYMILNIKAAGLSMDSPLYFVGREGYPEAIAVFPESTQKKYNIRETTSIERVGDCCLKEVYGLLLDPIIERERRRPREVVVEPDPTPDPSTPPAPTPDPSTPPAPKPAPTPSTKPTPAPTPTTEPTPAPTPTTEPTPDPKPCTLMTNEADENDPVHTGHDPNVPSSGGGGTGSSNPGAPYFFMLVPGVYVYYNKKKDNFEVYKGEKLY